MQCLPDGCREVKLDHPSPIRLNRCCPRRATTESWLMPAARKRLRRKSRFSLDPSKLLYFSWRAAPLDASRLCLHTTALQRESAAPRDSKEIAL